MFDTHAVYPLLLKPAVKDYLWGGNRLPKRFGVQSDYDVTAEAWVLSTHKNGHSTVQNGSFAGKTLQEALAAWGQTAPDILVKLIDARDRLSLQVHPDDAYAQKHHQSPGKTEMWYVLDAEPGAELICGFEREMTTEEFAAHIQNGTADKAVAHYPVGAGDVFFIPAGTVHAIGAGILVAEVQQNSDLTYRVWDWGRVGTDGKPRELHVDRALDVSVTKPYTVPCGQVGEVKAIKGGRLRTLAECDIFSAWELALQGNADIPADVRCVLCTEGSATLTSVGCEDIPLTPGACVYIPKGVQATVQGEGKALWIK